VHAALAVVSRFVIDLRLGPRTLESAAELLVSVAVGCVGGPLPLFLIDNHLPYPAAILQVFGVIEHRRRRHRRGRFKHPRLKPPPGLLAGVVEKVRDATGNLLRVRTRRLFGTVRALRHRIRTLGIGQDINTAHVERLNGTIRGQVARLGRRTRNVSRRRRPLQWALWLWRDLYNWVRPHGALDGRTPAMSLALTDQVWTMQQYVEHPVHVSDLQREIWAEQRKSLLESALDAYKRRKHLPTS
jgi:hypothetical protein